ncbi:MAG TPA: hypothetical protein VGG53_16580 [Mycobacterium sp.]|jgi:hypothetical protein|uniref:hypothetical protein n=1 Tax=Mycobacterium sp. TaxID=1785 RepID=UPI002F42D33E
MRNQVSLLPRPTGCRRCALRYPLDEVGKVERGQRSLRLETIIKIAAGLDIDAGDLVTELPLPPEPE